MSSTINTMLIEKRVLNPSKEFVANARISGMDQYRAMYEEAERNPDTFWQTLAQENLLWRKPFTKVLDESNAPFYTWFEDGELNVSENCLDVHLENGNADKTAIIFEADDGKVEKATYRQLHARVCRIANGFKALGYTNADRAIIYLPMSIEAIATMQACPRLGITHSVVFGGFSAKSLHQRVVDVGATLLVTADDQMRGGRAIPLNSGVDEALA